MSNFITNAELRIEAERLCDENDRLKTENAELRELVADCHMLLQRVCSSQDERGKSCMLWPDHGDECDLRKVERRMYDLEIEVIP